MSTHIPAATIQFLADLDANNTKEWFAANKKRYENELKKPGRALAETVNERLRALSPAHARDVSHKALNRINRDIRFSKDKTPYNTRLWAGFHNQSAPKGASAGLFFGLSPESVGIGCGAWQPPKDALDRLRGHIADNHRALTDAIGALPEGYGPLDGDKLKRVPKPWTAEHPAAELLKHKGLHIRIELPPETATQADFADRILEHFQRLLPIVTFLDSGLAP